MTRRRRRERREAPGPAGFLVVDKPPAWTSHDVVQAARGWLGTRRIGHLGTLDPLATGVLPLAIREATKLLPFMESADKTYVGAIRLGETTETLDAEGTVLQRHEAPLPDENAVRQVLSEFVGEIEQIPPMYSAVKQGGVPLHRLAREGRSVARAPKRVRIDRIELLKYAPPDVEIEVACTTGTYVRVLAADVGDRLGCGAHLAHLRRTQSGPFRNAMALPPEILAREAEGAGLHARIIPPVNVLGLSVLRLSEEEARRVRHGGDVGASGPPLTPGQKVAALDPGGGLVAILEVRPGRRLHPLRVLESVARQA